MAQAHTGAGSGGSRDGCIALKSRATIGLLAALLLAALLVVLVVAGIVSPALKAKRAEADAARLASAEQRFDAALANVEDVRGYLPHPASADDEIDPALEKLEASQADLAFAESQARRLQRSEGRSRYLEALASAQGAVTGLRDHVIAARTARDAIARGDEAYAAADRAYAASVKAGDSNDFSAMRSGAQKAERLFDEARDRYVAAETAYPGSSFADWIEDSRLSAEMAAIHAEMALAGSDGRFDDYDAGIDRAAEIEIRRQASAPVAEPVVDTEAKALGASTQALERAAALRSAALRLFAEER